MPITLAIPLPPFLHEADGEIRLRGHRISIVDILFFYREGYSAEMLAARYPSLNLSEIHYVLGFYHQNQTAIDTYLNASLADLDRLRQDSLASPQHSSLRQRLQAIRTAQLKTAHAS